MNHRHEDFQSTALAPGLAQNISSQKKTHLSNPGGAPSGYLAGIWTQAGDTSPKELSTTRKSTLLEYARCQTH